MLEHVYDTEKHPDLVFVKSNYAWILFKQGRYAEAEKIYQQSLAIRETFFGKEHPDVGRSYHDLSELYQKQGKYGQAEQLTKQALSIREKCLGNLHPDVGV